ncbi:MAG: hypothetical protein K6U80_03145 [Firmicutes bacterium]|nr:hypothetical protein [Bacillota bacterium]
MKISEYCSELQEEVSVEYEEVVVPLSEGTTRKKGKLLYCHSAEDCKSMGLNCVFANPSSKNNPLA